MSEATDADAYKEGSLRVGGPIGEVVEITVDGMVIDGSPGEPVAATLAAAGIRTLGKRSDGSPRGLFCAVGDCGDCALTIDGRRGMLACVETVVAGMAVETHTDA